MCVNRCYYFLLILQAVSVQYVPIPSQSPTIIIPTMQPAMPYVVPQVSNLNSMVSSGWLIIQSEAECGLCYVSYVISLSLSAGFCLQLSSSLPLSPHTRTPHTHTLTPATSWQPSCEHPAAKPSSHAHLSHAHPGRRY